jgi:uncharacterized membrane protein YqgA involved in biofilm formation
VEGGQVFRGAGTVLNVAAVLLGSGLGLALQGRLPPRTRSVLTDALGLATLLIGGLDAADAGSAAFARAVGPHATVLVVLAAVALGGLAGSAGRLGERLDSLGGKLRRRLAPSGSPTGRSQFAEGFVVASMVFCVGPLAVLGALADGAGRGIGTLALKSTLDGFASLAFASSLGWGVACSAGSVAVFQGALTLVGFLAGPALSAGEIAALTATGGLLLVGVGLRLLAVKQVPVVDLLPALAVAPALTAIVAALR